MMCYYGYRTGNGQGLRMLNPVCIGRPLKYWMDTPKETRGRPVQNRAEVTEELLQQIEEAILNGDTFKNQEEKTGFTYDKIYKAWRNSGRRVRNIRQRGLPETIQIQTIHDFAEWCEGRGIATRKSSDKRIIYCIQVMEGGRFQYRAIRKKDGKFAFSNGVAALFKRFLKDREDNRSSESA